MKNLTQWPPLSYSEFVPTQYFLHRVLQMIGKLKLMTPFEPHWANVTLWPMSRGLTTGAIPYSNGSFTVNIDFMVHKLFFSNSEGKESELSLEARSIAAFFQGFQEQLADIGVVFKFNPKPQEIPQAIDFDQDTENRFYDPNLANAWWRILLSSYQVLLEYHALFSGISPSPGFMWGTFDLRDARYSSKIVPPPKPGYIERNAMDVEQVEAGWWAGNELYPKPAYYAFTYPKPPGFENAKIKPNGATWNNTLGEFILDYEIVRTADNPKQMLLEFFKSTYQAGAELAGWDPKLNNSGKPQ